MYLVTTLVALLVAGSANALENPHRRLKHGKPGKVAPVVMPEAAAVADTSTYQHLNGNTEKFLVNSTGFPEIYFDIGESYAGTLPNTPSGNSSLFFWFFPSKNPKATDEITIWLNGGPGCSSLVGLLQENGPFLWQEGTYRPTPNPYSWVNLTNMVWVDQPAGTGFSPGPPTVNNEVDVANQFKDFFKRFVDTFDLHGRKVYITGESYAGQYIPYIASGMLDENDTTYFNVKGIQINDPSINNFNVLSEIPAVAFVKNFQNIFNFNETFMQHLTEADLKCGYTKYLNEALTYPPKKPFPTAPNPQSDECDVWDQIYDAAFYINPCFNIYHITDYCPYLWDEMGFPSLGGGPNDYFNRTDVQKALHAPPTNYLVCGESDVFPNGDFSLPSALGPLPSVIERTNNTIIGHGLLDFILLANGTLLTIQNMTWNGAQGFQRPPTERLFVPYHPSLSELVSGTPPVPFLDNAGAGYLGFAHTERGLTFSSVFNSGHEIPQYVPGAAYRQLEFLLGRIKNLSEIGPYTTTQ